MRNFFSNKSQISMIKKALKKSEQDPFLYETSEIIKLKSSLRNLRDKEEQDRQLLNRGFGYDKTIES